jgi:hypothetical protein
MMQCIRHRTVTSRARQVTFCRKPMSEVGYAPDVAFHLTALAAGEAVSLFCARQAPGRTSSSCPTSSEARGAEARGPCRRRQTRQVSACRRVRAPEFSESGAALAQPSSVSPGGHSPATVRPPDRHATVERASPLRSVLEHGRSIRNCWESRNCDAAPSSQEGCGAERPMPRVLVTVRGASRKRRDRRRMSWFAVRPLHTTPKERRATSNRERRKRHTREI